MTLQITKWTAIVALCLILAVPATAGVYFTELGGGKQIWVTADSFTARDANQHWAQDTAATGTLSGSAYYFPNYYDPPSPISGGPNSNAADSLDWWGQYEIDAAAAPVGWGSLEDTVWSFYARAVKTSDLINGLTSVDANFLIVNGHSGDINTLNPTDQMWYDAANPNNLDGGATTADDRIENAISALGLHEGYENWGWWSDSSGDETAQVIRSKKFGVFNGKVTYRIYEREAYDFAARTDLMVWTQGGYAPTDADARIALGLPPVPEPSSLAALALGMPAMFFFVRRRRS